MQTVASSVQTITPEVAEVWLKRARNSAKLDRRTVASYAADMSSGRWKMNGEPIVLGRAGQLLSGRLRLAACIEAQVGFPALVIQGIDDAGFETIDAVRRRTVGDILTIRKEPDGRALASALSAIWRYSHRAFGRRNPSRSSAQQLLEILEENPEIRTSMILTGDVTPILPHGLAAALHYLFSCVDGDKASSFFQGICDPSNVSHPAPGMLRKQMDGMLVQGGARNQEFLIGLTIKAWEAFRNERQISLLRYVVGNEELPLISGLPSGMFDSKGRLKHNETNDATEFNVIIVDVEEITPARAATILDHNDGNRRIATAVVDKYARDIKAGSWQLNGQTIKIGASGRLLDGQHRCAAAIQANASFKAIVVKGLDEAVFDTFDLGAQRSVADILIDRGESNTSTLAAVIRQVWLLRNGLIQLRTVTPSVAELLQVLEDNPGIRESVRHAYKIRNLMAPGLACALHYLFSRSSPERAQQFIDRLGDGANLSKGDAILMLREKLIRDKGSKKRSMADAERAAVIIKAWNAFQSNLKLQTLRWVNAGPRREEFPTILEGDYDE